MDKVKQRVWDVVSYKKNIGALQTKIQVLKEEVTRVQTLLMGANDTKDGVPNWFTKADEIIKDANGILDGVNDMADKKRLYSTCWDPSSSWEVGEMLRGIDKILEEIQGFDLSSYFCGLSHCNRLQSREHMLQEILEALVEIHTNFIGIYGMIGVGKTILAKELARHAQNNQLFDVILMVPVSESVDVKHIQCQIAKKIGLQLSEVDDEETRAHFLYNALKEKFTDGKILVILDGIQCVIDLERVGISYGHDERENCKVVLVSRNADICREMGAEKQFLVDCLNLDEAKVLFKERLGGKIENMEIALERYQYMEHLFLIKCRGLPLVINSLAFALRSMSWSEWESVADEMERHTLIEVDGVKEVPCALLELCSKFIQNQEKRKLFLLCCIIQQGVDVSLAKLVRYGIGFNLFEVDSFSSFLGQINSWADELKSLSLLIEGKERKNVKMHDIIQDVAISALSQGDCILHVLLDASTCWNSKKSYENCVAISMTSDGNYKCLSGLELYKLQAFLLKGTSSSAMHKYKSLSLLDNFFKGMLNLRILEISAMVFEDFPSSIGDLKNLVTLHLEYCHIRCGLNSMMSNLSKVLEVLSLRGSKFRGLPEEVGNLTSLRVLDLTECQIVTFPVDAVAKLYQLRELYLYCDYWIWSTNDIAKLTSLPLELLEIKIPNNCQVYPSADLQRFVILSGDRFDEAPSYQDFTSFSRVLIFIDGPWIGESGFGNLLPRTEFLQIEGFSGVKGSVVDKMKCILDTSKPHRSIFQKLRELRVINCDYSYLLPIQLALKLRVVEVSNCDSLFYIFPTSGINETDGADLVVELPCLEKLVLKGLRSLIALHDVVELPIHTGPQHLLFNEKINLPSIKELHLEGLDQIVNLWDAQLLNLQSGMYSRTPCFGNLKYMTIYQCNSLKSLFPSSTVTSLLQLEKLVVHRCSYLEEIITCTHIQDYTNPTNVLTFPKLQTLELKDLSTLKCFCRGHLLLEFPMLRELDLEELGQVKAFILPNTESPQTQRTTPLFHEIEFPSLEQLRVDGMLIESIHPHDETTIIFPNLLSLRLRNLPKLKVLQNMNSKSMRSLDLEKVYAPCMSLVMSCELEELILSAIDGLEDLLDDEKSVDEYGQFDLKLFLSWSKLELKHLMLKSISWNRLTNLRSLTIYFALDSTWTTLIPSSWLVGGCVLLLLESLKVQYCYRLVSIISEELLRYGDAVKYGITIFPSLKHIEIYGLIKLESFSMGRYEAHLPSLETLEIGECHSLRSFSMGSLETPRLKSVKVDGKISEASHFDDLNATVTALGQAAAEENRAAEVKREAERKAERERRFVKGKVIRKQKMFQEFQRQYPRLGAKD